jgi:hypothetical protein
MSSGTAGNVVAVVTRDGPGLKSLLTVLAGVMQETAGRFEDTSSRVAQLVLGGPDDEVGGDLVTTLQNFDRLRQELVAISDVLSGCVGSQEETIRRDPQTGIRDLVGAVPVADLRRRLSSRLGLEAPAQEPVAEEEF